MLSIKNLTISRSTGKSSFKVCLPELLLNSGEIVVLKGDSGCGKSTLLEMIGMILQPDKLEQYLLTIAEQPIDVAALINNNKFDKLAAIRCNHLGFMLQTGGLLPFLTIEDNILLPLRLLQKPADKNRFDYLVNQLNIAHLLKKHPKQLSIGERQRASFIRSIIHKPAVLLADEPTSALDPYNANLLFDLIIEQTRQDNISAIIVTHDWSLVQQKGLYSLTAKLEDQHTARFVSTHNINEVAHG